MKCITPFELTQLLQDSKLSERIALIDVREYNEIQESMINGAIHIALSELTLENVMHNIDFPKKDHIVFYCRAGIRSQLACKIIEASAHELSSHILLFSLDEGIIGWMKTKSQQFACY